MLVKPRFETRAKVRVGIKNARGLPTSVDYFVCDDPEFLELYPGRHQQLEVTMPYADAASCFDQSLEAWKGQVLGCHSQDGQRAKRRTFDGVTFAASAEPMAIPCPFRACDWYQARDCKVTGRLRFFLTRGADRSRVLCLDTHAYGSIEAIGAATSMAERLGVLQLAQGRLTVEMVKRDRKQFPLVTLHLAAAATQQVSELDELKAIMARDGVLDDPGARAWVERVGVEAALQALRARG